MAVKRVVFLHYHLYKNAGTAIDRVFEKAGGPIFHLESDDPDETIGNEALLNLLRERSDLWYISSHALKPPRPVVPGYHLIDIVFLRHPIDRFRSIYDFSRANTDRGGPTELAARRFGLREFSVWMANEAPWNFFDPQTTIMGSGGDFFHPPGELDLENAVRRTLQVRLLGTVELFSNSMRAASCYLRGVRRDIDLVPLSEPVNATLSREATLGARIRFVRDALGAQAFERLEEALRLDLRLWKAATSEVSRRYRMFYGWRGGAPVQQGDSRIEQSLSFRAADASLVSPD
jgi:hypothetical protein